MADPRRDVRKLAMQWLYQLDQSGEDEPPAWEALAQEVDEDFHPDPAAAEAGAKLAIDAWRARADADALTTSLAPDWPAHRQPPVDKAVLRLALHEIAGALAPAKLAINEAVELAKRFGAEHSPAFVNGVLDKAARRLGKLGAPTPGTGNEPSGEADAEPGPTPSPAAWLNDALRP